MVVPLVRLQRLPICAQMAHAPCTDRSARADSRDAMVDNHACSNATQGGCTHDRPVAVIVDAQLVPFDSPRLSRARSRACLNAANGVCSSFACSAEAAALQTRTRVGKAFATRDGARAARVKARVKRLLNWTFSPRMELTRCIRINAQARPAVTAAQRLAALHQSSRPSIAPAPIKHTGIHHKSEAK